MDTKSFSGSHGLGFNSQPLLPYGVVRREYRHAFLRRKHGKETERSEKAKESKERLSVVDSDVEWGFNTSWQRTTSIIRRTCR